MLAGDGLDMDLTPQTMAAVLYATTTFSLLGVCCAIIFRSQATAVLVLVGAFVAEKLWSASSSAMRSRTCPTGR